MCILCVVQKWSRRVATMLPWLVIPLIGLWALSQLLPPGFRFEVTSPRLACVLVLLVTLFWYEILMPQLSAWRARRNEFLREKKRSQAIEMQKLRKMATRRCRNCLTPYRDQNPGGGRFMCSYCGHLSKRPVLDMPECTQMSLTHDPRFGGLSIANSGVIGDLVSKSGKIWNGKVWLENGWSGGQDSLENGNWATVVSPGKSNYQGRNRDECISSGSHCLGGETYPGLVYFGCKLFSSFLLSIRWISRTIFRVSFSREDALSEADNKGMLSKKGENGMNFNESKGEKARRKAEEKRQARLERELLAEEERKQREEVARLVEERRRLRDENMEAEKERDKGSTPELRKDSKREAEKKRQERRKEKDKGSSKSNSDVEDLERRAGKESDKKKRSEIERRETQKSATESAKVQGSEACLKLTAMNNISRVNGAKYLDRVNGSLLSSSKALNGASFFGKGTHTSANVWRMNKPNSYVDHAQAASNLRDVNFSGQVPGRPNSFGGDKITEPNFQRPVVSEQLPKPAPIKSWQQLFTRTSATPLASNANTTCMLNQIPLAGAQSPHIFGQVSPTQPLDNPIHSTTSLPFALSPVSNVPTRGGTVYSSAFDPMFFPSGKLPAEIKPEELELFEDPCYGPDPVSLLGPVSESLDNFPLDLGSGFAADAGLEKLHSPKYVSASDEVSRPSPIESPLSRLRIVEEKRVNSSQMPVSPKVPGLKLSSMGDSSNEQEQGTWHMWGTPPLGQDGLGLIGGPASWILPLGQNQLNPEDGAHPSPHKATASQFAWENQVLPSAGSPQKDHLGNCHNVGTFDPLGPCSNDNCNGAWLQKNAFHPCSSDAENSFTPFNLEDVISRNEVSYDNPSGSTAGHPFESSPANLWSKKDLAVHSSGEGVGNSFVARPRIGGLFSNPDVQSVWSFN